MWCTTYCLNGVFYFENMSFLGCSSVWHLLEPLRMSDICVFVSHPQFSTLYIISFVVITSGFIMFNAVPTYSALPGSSSSDDDDEDVAGGGGDAVRTPESSSAHLLSADRSETVTAVAALWRDAITNGRVLRLQWRRQHVAEGGLPGWVRSAQRELKLGDDSEHGLDIENIFLKSHPGQRSDQFLNNRYMVEFLFCSFYLRWILLLTFFIFSPSFSVSWWITWCSFFLKFCDSQRLTVTVLRYHICHRHGCYLLIQNWSVNTFLFIQRASCFIFKSSVLLLFWACCWRCLFPYFIFDSHLGVFALCCQKSTMVDFFPFCFTIKSIFFSSLVVCSNVSVMCQTSNQNIWRPHSRCEDDDDDADLMAPIVWQVA